MRVSGQEEEQSENDLKRCSLQVDTPDSCKGMRKVEGGCKNLTRNSETCQLHYEDDELGSLKRLPRSWEVDSKHIVTIVACAVDGHAVEDC